MFGVMRIVPGKYGRDIRHAFLKMRGGCDGRLQNDTYYCIISFMPPSDDFTALSLRYFSPMACRSFPVCTAVSFLYCIPICCIAMPPCFIMSHICLMATD